MTNPKLIREGGKMTRILLDAETVAQLHNLNEVLEVCDESGQTRGFFHPTGPEQPNRSPFAREQLEEFRKQKSGRPLAQIIRDLEQQ
jgi:hypothetical protein